MGRLVVQHVRSMFLELDADDFIKQKKRREEHNKFPVPTRDQLAFCQHLMSCSECGSKPHPLIVGEYGDYSIKMSCTGNAFHNCCGNWQKSFARAGKEWNKENRESGDLYG